MKVFLLLAALAIVATNPVEASADPGFQVCFDEAAAWSVSENTYS